MVEVHLQVNDKLLQTGKLNQFSCPKCKEKGNLEYRIYGGIVSFLLIPMLPKRKITKLFCNNCHIEFGLNKSSLDIKQAINYEKEKRPINTPLWHFTGFFVLISILSFATYIGIEMTKLEKIYIRKPEKNDIYKANFNGEYTTLKVENVKKDSVIVLLNKYKLSSYKGLEEINIEKNYNTPKTFSKKELLNMYYNNTIYEINRD